MAKKEKKKYSPSLAIKEMQIKITLISLHSCKKGYHQEDKQQ
jgi:hypothetical protein